MEHVRTIFIGASARGKASPSVVPCTVARASMRDQLTALDLLATAAIREDRSPLDGPALSTAYPYQPIRGFPTAEGAAGRPARGQAGERQRRAGASPGPAR